jgi:hypothetical protein
MVHMIHCTGGIDDCDVKVGVSRFPMRYTRGIESGDPRPGRQGREDREKSGLEQQRKELKRWKHSGYLHRIASSDTLEESEVVQRDSPIRDETSWSLGLLSPLP